MIQFEMEKLATSPNLVVSLYQQELESRIRMLKQRVEQADKQNEDLTRTLAARNEEISEYQKHIKALQISVETLSGFPHKVADEDLPSEDIPLSSGYGEMSTWAEIYLPNKLILLPRAVHSLDKEEFRSPELVGTVRKYRLGGFTPRSGNGSGTIAGCGHSTSRKGRGFSLSALLRRLRGLLLRHSTQLRSKAPEAFKRFRRAQSAANEKNRRIRRSGGVLALQVSLSRPTRAPRK